MKKLLLVAIISLFGTTAFSAQWVQLAKRVDGTIYSIEKGTLLQRGNSLQFWLKADPPGPLQLADGREYYKTESHVVILCPQDKFSIVKIKYFDNSNNVIETQELLSKNNNLIYKDIFPSSIEDYIAAKFCN